MLAFGFDEDPFLNLFFWIFIEGEGAPVSNLFTRILYVLYASMNIYFIYVYLINSNIFLSDGNVAVW